MFRKLVTLAAISALKPSTEAAELVRVTSDNSRFSDDTKAHGLFKSSSINKQDPSVLKFTCPNSKDVENQLNKSWIRMPPSKCDTFPSSTDATYYPLPNPLENLYGGIHMVSCKPYIELAQEVELAVINQTCNYWGRIVNTSFVGCSYKITNSTDVPYPSGIEIGCDPQNQTAWWPMPGHFMLTAALLNSTTCSIEGGNFSCLRDIPRDPMSGTWQPVDDLYPYFNYDDRASRVNYTYSITGDDESTCCVVQVSGFGTREVQTPYGDSSFIFNPDSLNVTRNKTEVCTSVAFINKALSGIKGTWFKFLDSNTIAVNYDEVPYGTVCNASTKLILVNKTEDTESTPPSVKPRF